ncbi:DUF6575 domain-containing protein [Lactobacillus sp. ESL0261]|uniref:DUF6575 domain-containing protein n=1 Tax=Lactobacillus sp. ESL0261 TaxID=2069348 RepID=UPI000EFC7737|nr:DUF6575 domain-containing protein [Lactobacillus sp. ESL0261]RMC55081.1 hypothetical protein F5ESL0261_04110 [Lactobacillus sp. ESL0261]
MRKIKHVPFKQINIYHIYDYYDEPILYSFASETGELFVANFIDYEENSDTDVWAFLPVTFDKLRHLENSDISLLDLYKNPVSQITYIEKKNTNQDEFFIEETAKIKSSCLPDEDSFIEYEDISTLKNSIISDQISKDNRYGLNISIRPIRFIHEISVSMYTIFLKELQNLLIAIKQPKNFKTLIKRYVEDTTTQLQVAGTYPGSFGTKLLSNGVSSLINDDEALPYKKLVELFQETQNGNKIDSNEIVEKYGWLVLEHLNKFSECITGVKGGKIQAEIPRPGEKTEILDSHFTPNNISKFINKVDELSHTTDEETKTMSGYLTRYDFNQKKFTLTVIGENDKSFNYNGIVKTEREKFVIPAYGQAKLNVIVSSDHLNRVKERVTYELLSWESSDEAD